MTDLEDVTQRLEALERSSRSDIPTQFSPALRRFRFIPRAERRACADAFFVWASGGVAEPVKLGYAVFLQGMDRFIAEELRDSLALLTRARARAAGAARASTTHLELAHRACRISSAGGQSQCRRGAHGARARDA